MVTATSANVTEITLPDSWWFNQIASGPQGPVLDGSPAGDVDQRSCVLGDVSPQTLAVAVDHTTSCSDPSLAAQAVEPLVSYVPDSNNATVSIARHDPQTGQVVVGPVVMTFGDYSDTKLIWTYGPGSLWIYDVESTAGPEAIAVSSSTGQVESLVAAPKLYRPLIAANADGLWLGNSVEGAGERDVLYHLAPGSHSATDVLPGNTQHVFWMVGDGDHLWAGIGPVYTNQAIWRFDGPNGQPAFHVPDHGFDPSVVVGSATAGLWTVGPYPVPTKVPSAPYPDQDVIRIDPDTGTEQVFATIKGIPIPISLSGGTTSGQLAYFDGSLFMLEPPFLASDGYMGFSTLIRVNLAQPAA